MLWDILIWYGFLSYIVVGLWIFISTNWSTEWDNTELKMYMFAPLTLIILLAFALREVLARLSWFPRSAKPWPYVFAGLILWVIGVSIVYALLQPAKVVAAKPVVRTTYVDTFPPPYEPVAQATSNVSNY